MVLYFRIFLFFQYWKMILRQSGVALHPTIIVKKLMGKDHLTKNPTAKAAQNADILVYRSAEMTTVQIKINIQKNEGHKRYLGLKIGDSFLDSKGFRCVVTDIIRKDPYQDWQDLAPTLSVDEYPSVSYGHGRKWNR